MASPLEKADINSVEAEHRNQIHGMLVTEKRKREIGARESIAHIHLR